MIVRTNVTSLHVLQIMLKTQKTVRWLKPFNEISNNSLMFTDFNVHKIHEQPEKNSTTQSMSINNFRLHFFKDSEQAIEKRKKEARKPIKLVAEKHMELSLMDIYPPNVLLNFPKRPSWSYSLSKEKLDAQEQKYFKDYISQIIRQDRCQELSYFELNLETWRQLWRVLELSDILLIISDARFPALHLPPSLIKHVVEDLHKLVIIILNKIDFVPPIVVSLWKHYLESQFPGTRVILFSSFLKEREEGSNFFNLDSAPGLNKKPRQGSSLVYGPSQLFEICCEIAKGKVDLSSWKNKLEQDGLLMADESGSNCHQFDRVPCQKDQSCTDKKGDDLDPQSTGEFHYDHDHHQKTLFSNGILTLGCIGFPNVGKSSVLNTLVGKKVVSVSQTPGHTKHFQTIFLTPTVKLCDCPGLVFPSLVPKALQVIAGIFPVAQVREPYSVVGYLAKRVDLPRMLNLQPPDSSPKKRDKTSGDYIWSAYSICEAWALNKGFLTAKAGRPDLYRAANKILRMMVDGQICLHFKPPNYKDYLEQATRDPVIQSLHDFQKSPLSHISGVREERDDEDESTDEEEEEDSVKAQAFQNLNLLNVEEDDVAGNASDEDDDER